MRLYTRREQGLPRRDWKFGPLGPVTSVVIHHSAGPVARTKADAIRLNKLYDEAHAIKFGDGIGYHYSMDIFGRLYKLRPRRQKGAHVQMQNSGRLGLMVHGDFTTSKLNLLQRRALRKLYRGESGIEEMKVFSEVPWLGHLEVPQQATTCPGTIMNHIRYLRNHGR